jgi:hypothetical protein
VNIGNGVDGGVVRVYHRGRSGTYPEKKEEAKVNKRQEKALANAEAKLAGQIAHVERMIAAGQPEAGVQIARRLVLAFTMEVEHLKAGNDPKSFDIFAAGRAALAAFPSLQGKESR